MADGISAIFHISDVQAEFARLDKATDRATMWGLRETGRLFKQTAKRAAPVYQGSNAVSRKQHKTGGGGLTGPPVKGLLRSSIGTSRNLTSHGTGTYSIVAGPRGPRVHLYAAKVEASKPYVRPAYEAAIATAAAVHAGAWEKAMRRR